MLNENQTELLEKLRLAESKLDNGQPNVVFFNYTEIVRLREALEELDAALWSIYDHDDI